MRCAVVSGSFLGWTVDSFMMSPYYVRIICGQGTRALALTSLDAIDLDKPWSDVSQAEVEEAKDRFRDTYALKYPILGRIRPDSWPTPALMENARDSLYAVFEASLPGPSKDPSKDPSEEARTGPVDLPEPACVSWNEKRQRYVPVVPVNLADTAPAGESLGKTAPGASRAGGAVAKRRRTAASCGHRGTRASSASHQPRATPDEGTGLGDSSAAQTPGGTVFWQWDSAVQYLGAASATGLSAEEDAGRSVGGETKKCPMRKIVKVAYDVYGIVSDAIVRNLLSAPSPTDPDP